jgi:hypothetical protein
MTPEQKAAYVMAMVAIFNAQIAGMVAENMQREHLGGSMAYTEKEFQKVIDESGCGCNSIAKIYQEW